MLLVIPIDRMSDGRCTTIRPRCSSEANVWWLEVDVEIIDISKYVHDRSLK
jgi:hypothetical protein